MLADARCTQWGRDLVLNDFSTTPSCCLRPGMAQQLKAARTDLRDPRNCQWIPAWALTATLSISDTEWAHATNRRFSQPARGATVRFEGIAANGILHHAKASLNASKRRQAAFLRSLEESESQSAAGHGPS